METVVVEIKNEMNGRVEEIEIPLSITASDLIYALNRAYGWGLNEDNISEQYLSSENPIAYLKGEKLLSEYGLRNGSTIIFKR